MCHMHIESNSQLYEIQPDYAAFLSYLLHAQNPNSSHYHPTLKFMKRDCKCTIESIKNYLNIAKVGRDYYYEKNGIHPHNPILKGHTTSSLNIQEYFDKRIKKFKELEKLSFFLEDSYQFEMLENVINNKTFENIRNYNFSEYYDDINNDNSSEDLYFDHSEEINDDFFDNIFSIKTGNFGNNITFSFMIIILQ